MPWAFAKSKVRWLQTGKVTVTFVLTSYRQSRASLISESDCLLEIRMDTIRAIVNEPILCYIWFVWMLCDDVVDADSFVHRESAQLRFFCLIRSRLDTQILQWLRFRGEERQETERRLSPAQTRKPRKILRNGKRNRTVSIFHGKFECSPAVFPLNQRFFIPTLKAR